MKRGAGSPTNWLQITAGAATYVLEFSSRDWKVISKPNTHSGDLWMKEFGFLGPPDTSVSKGLEIGYDVAGNRLRMLAASRSLLAEVIEDAELLQYDYWVTLRPGFHGGTESRHGGGGVGGIRVAGVPHMLWLRAGQCRLQAFGETGETVSVIDLRRERSFVGDDARQLAIHRRRKGLAWPETLPPLIDFLSGLTAETVDIYNHHQ